LAAVSLPNCALSLNNVIEQKSSLHKEADRGKPAVPFAGGHGEQSKGTRRYMQSAKVRSAGSAMATR
jgi:hypothetical protein